MNSEKTKCLILGSGPAGYTAAIYASRANLRPVLYEGMLSGGQLTTTTDIENFPGYPEGIGGFEMMEDFKKQAQRFGADVRNGVATDVDMRTHPFRVTIDGEKVIEAESLIIATGATARYLGIPGENEFKGQGVSACATCDGFFYRGQNVAVVGGGDTACEDANYLSTLCNKVYLVVRKDYLRASKAMQKRVMENPNIEILFEHVPKEVVGDDSGVTGLMVDNKGTMKKLDITGLFVAIGHTPQTKLFEGQLELDLEGYIAVEEHGVKTNIKGVFAAGDVRDPHYRQAIVAAGSGCMAAMEAERYLMLSEDAEGDPFKPKH